MPEDVGRRTHATSRAGGDNPTGPVLRDWTEISLYKLPVLFAAFDQYVVVIGGTGGTVTRANANFVERVSALRT